MTESRSPQKGKMKHAEKIITDSAFYSACTIGAQVIGVFTSIAMRRFLTPEMMGIWVSLLVVLNYLLLTEMGVFTAIEVRIPFLRGEGKEGDVQDMRDTAFTFALMLAFSIAALLLGASFFMKGIFSPETVLGIRMLALIIAFTLFYNFYVVMLRADKDFKILSWALLFNAAAMLVSVSLLTYFFSLKGMYFAVLTAIASSCIFMKMRTSYRLRPVFKKEIAWSLLKVGFPILVAGGVCTVFMSVDKIAILRMIGARELGYYSIAVLALTYTNTLPKLFTIVLFPNMQEAYGRTGSREHALGYVKEAAMTMAYLFPAVLAGAYFVMPVVVHYVLPKYIPGLESMRILLIGCFFLSLAPLGEKFVFSLNKQAVMIPITLFVTGFGAALVCGMIKAGYGINGAATGISAAYFVYFTIVYFYALKHCETVARIALSFATVLAPFVYAVASVAAVELFLGDAVVLVKAIAGGALWIALYSPVLIYVNMKTGIISRMWNAVRRKPVLNESELASEKVMVEEGVEI